MEKSKSSRASKLSFIRLTATPSVPSQPNNGDEDDENFEFLGNFHKSLPHNDDGRVNKVAYKSLMKASKNDNATPQDFEAVLAYPGADKLADPMGGFATGDIFPDPHYFTIAPAPSIASRDIGAEMVELYWMALLRDVPFSQLGSDPSLQAAITDLEATLVGTTLVRGLGGDFPSAITQDTIFRGTGPGESVGPLLSQFWLRDAPYGVQTISQRQIWYPGRTVAGESGVPFDYLFRPNDWLRAQNTGQDHKARPYEQANRDERPDAPTRYPTTMRDLASFVHRDALHQAYFNSALILLSYLSHGNIWDKGNPYNYLLRQKGFGTFGGPFLLTAVSEVASRALQVQWFQKWRVHRRLRPEAFGGVIQFNHDTRLGFPFDIRTTDAAQRIYKEYGSYLLPLAYSSGSPTHPAYGAGHATVAGACVTVLKTYFDDEAPFPGEAYEPNANGTIPFQKYTGGGLTIGGELNKMASNVAMGRSMGGVHFRTDNMRSLRVGEELAAVVIARQLGKFRESDGVRLSYQSFGGQRIEITKTSIIGYDSPTDTRLTQLILYQDLASITV